jgi:DNA helicase IV
VCGSELTFVSKGDNPEKDQLRCDVCEPIRFFRAGDLIGDLAAQRLRSVHDSVVFRNITMPGLARPAETTFAHVVVDEAQDLSAMQWRSIVRRCPTLSMTVVGDQGQAIRPGATGSWDAAVEATGATSFELTELTVNYRTPTEVMAAAEAALTEAGVPFSSTRSVRSTAEPSVTCVEAITPAAVASVVDAIDVEGTRAVIAPRSLCSSIPGAIDVVEAKGLEFDAVVVVDPDAIAAEGEGGARRVYVAMTRTTNLLHVIRRGAA